MHIIFPIYLRSKTKNPRPLFRYADVRFSNEIKLKFLKEIYDLI